MHFTSGPLIYRYSLVGLLSLPLRSEPFPAGPPSPFHPSSLSFLGWSRPNLAPHLHLLSPLSLHHLQCPPPIWAFFHPKPGLNSSPTRASPFLGPMTWTPRVARPLHATPSPCITTLNSTRTAPFSPTRYVHTLCAAM